MKDSAGNPYIDIDNVRVTMVDKSGNPTKDWAGSVKYLRVQAYTGRGNSLHRGAEFPVDDIKKILDFINSITNAGKYY
jgi:hypothetical protein